LATGLISQDEALDAALLLEIKNEGEYSYPFVSSSKQDLPFLGIFISGLLEWLKSRLNVENYEKTEGISLLEEDALFHSEIKNELLKLRKGSKVAAICGTEGLSRHKLEDYWKGNREATLKGVQIRRVFVIAKDIHRSDRDAFINALKWHEPISETEHSLGSIEPRYVRIVESVSDPILGTLPKECDFGFMGILGQRLSVRRWFPLTEQKRPITGLGYRTESKIALQLYFSFFEALWIRAKPLTGDTLDAITNVQKIDES